MKPVAAIQLHEFIVLERRRQKLTCGELAKKAGIARSSLWRVENHDPNTKLSTLIAVVEALGFCMDVRLNKRVENEKDLEDAGG